MRKIPPYGKALYDLYKKNLKPEYSIRLFIGSYAWSRAKIFAYDFPERTLLIPPWLCPSDYFFPVKQCKVLIVDTSFAENDYLDDLAYCLFKDEADFVICNQPDANFINFKKDFNL